jgi:hypothetical protein
MAKQHAFTTSPYAPLALQQTKSIFSLFTLLLFTAGISYEAAFFYEMNLRAWDYFSLSHFFLSGVQLIFPCAVIAVVLAMFWKFFSGDLLSDDWHQIRKGMSRTTVKKEYPVTGIAVTLTFLYSASVFFDCHLPFSGDTKLVGIFLYVMFAFTIIYVRLLLLTAVHARAALSVVFVVTWSVCAAAGGFGEARSTRMNSSIRDDFVVKIERVNGEIKVAARPLSFSICVSQLKIQFGGNCG